MKNVYFQTLNSYFLSFKSDMKLDSVLTCNLNLMIGIIRKTLETNSLTITKIATSLQLTLPHTQSYCYK